MSLWQTLVRRLRNGHPEAVRNTFDYRTRVAVTYDVSVLMYSEEARCIDVRRLARLMEIEMHRQVFGGFDPTGPFHKKLAQEYRFSDPDIVQIIRANVIDASSDLESLDALSIVLRLLKDAADQKVSAFGAPTRTWGPYGPPMEVQFAGAVDELIADVNERLRDTDVGYQFHHPNFVRAPETELDAGIIEPALRILRQNQEFIDTDREFRNALNAWKRQDAKAAVHHSGEALEGMLRVMVKQMAPAQHRPSLQVVASIQILNEHRLWRGPHAEIMKKIAALRGDIGAHSEATKPVALRANQRDADSLVFLTGAMLHYLGSVYEDSK